MKQLKTLLVLLSFVCTIKCEADRPCSAKWYPGQSSGCVCTAKYCDELTRSPPTPGKYVSYTSSKDGLRLRKSSGNVSRWTPWTYSTENYDKMIILNPSVTYQTIEGFGGAVTDSAGINWKNVSQKLQQQLVNSYYGEKGIGYTMARVPIAGCDFSTRSYTYNDYANDTSLNSFSLQNEDYNYKIPMLKAIRELRPSLKIVASSWQPPSWMKKKADSVCGELKKEYFQSYADYHRKFIENYVANGIPIWAITTSNEPGLAFIGIPRSSKKNCLLWKSGDMANWIANNLGPTIRELEEKVLIYGVDDQRYLITYWFYKVINDNPKAAQYLDGIAVHFYEDDATPPSILDDVTKSHPDKKLLYTESCNGAGEEHHVILGSWERAEKYIKNMITNINHSVTGWLDWNLCLNAQGGPNWIGNYVDSPIIVFPEGDYFVKSPTFYAMAHVAKFVVPGSKRIKHIAKDQKKNSVEQFAVVTPEDTVVVVLANKGNSTATVGVQLADQLIELKLSQRSFTTVEFTKELSGCEVKTLNYKVAGTATAVESNEGSVSITYNTC